MKQSALVLFYKNRAPDNKGRMLEDILQWDDKKLESTHNFIQWLFPLPEQSGANPSAPRLSLDDNIECFRSDERIRENIPRSLERMLTFYGLELDQSSQIVKRSSKFNKRSSSWLTPWNHNFLRITRILRSLTLTGFEELSAAFFACLEEIYRSHAAEIGSTSFQYWRQACQTD
jgi:hypothetical protein